MSLEELQEQIERIYIDIENELLLNISKKLSSGKPMEIDKWDTEKGEPIIGSGNVNEWQLQRLKELNGLNEENARIIAKYSGKTVEEVEKVFERAKEIGMTRDETIIAEGVRLGILNEINPITEEFLVKGIIESATKEVLTTFNKQNNSLLISAGSEYTEIVNKVSSQVLAGTKTTMKAMQEAVTQMSEQGLTGFTARNGARWSPEAYTKMVIRSNTQNTINHIQDERIKLAGGNYIEVSSHIGARPLCSEDQGHIFSLNNDTKPIEDLDGNKIEVRAWSSSSCGEPAGIFGINCGHSRYMFVPGLSVKRDVDFTKKENDEAYIEKQQQRLYERTIRHKKREIKNLEEMGAEDTYIRRKKDQLRGYTKQYVDFLDETGRTRIRANEWIGSSSLSEKSKDKSDKAYQKWKAKEDKKKQDTGLIGLENIILDKVDTTKTAIKLDIGQVFDYKGNKYIVDNKNVKNEFKPKELEFANWLSQRIKQEITLNPKINNPEGIKVPDLKIGSEYYDMKIITGGSNQVIYHNVYKKNEQAENFLFEATKSPLSMELLRKQANSVFERKDTGYVNKIGIKKGENFILLENKKRSDDTRR